jgi:hypothetical protein
MQALATTLTFGRSTRIGCSLRATEWIRRAVSEMTAFPVFETLNVRDYGLFPGNPPGKGLAITFEPGLTLVLGANGLGKTTLVSLLYRLCSGPYDIPGLGSGGALGDRSVQARALSRPDRRLFAVRVADNAANATATLVMRLGEARIHVTRSLASLDLAELRVDDEPFSPSEPTYQRLVRDFAGLTSFGDWILVLRHLVFYFEDRRALVWDPSAQRQILRILFAKPTTGTEWVGRERDILERDSAMRNLQAALYKEEATLAIDEASVGQVDEVRAELAVLEQLQEVDEPKLQALNDRVVGSDAARHDARLTALQAELDRESAFRDLERYQLRAIDSAFPTMSETARYLLGQLFTDGECLACGSNAPQAATSLRSRLQGAQCVVCGTHLESDSVRSFSPRAIARATRAVDQADEHLVAARAERIVAEAAYDSLLNEINDLAAKVSSRRSRIDALVLRLPPDEVALHTRRDELAALRGRVELMKRELADRRAEFAVFIKSVNRGISRHKADIKSSFEGLAKDFLLEDLEISWAPHRARVGQGGEQFSFPAFELKMGGAGFPSPVRRTGPQQVSESQREFIDLAFRMTLMRVGSSSPGTSLVIDAPESSLDAVFVNRAADVLTRFADPGTENRLVITSNLIEGNLIPGLIRKAKIRSASDRRIVDLLKLAAPTAATQKLKSEYQAVRRALFARARSKRA